MKQRFSLKSDTGMIKLSHMSVKDYLLSQHSAGATGFGINEKLSHSHIAKTCLAYLLQFEHLDMLNPYTIGKYPLTEYAAKYWVMHVRYGVGEGKDVQQDIMIMTLFQPCHTAPFISWARIYDIDDPLAMFGNIYNIPSTFYYASSAGILLAVQGLLNNGVDVNVQGGRFGYALEAASYWGHDMIVDFLVKKGADVNAQGGEYGNALQAASSWGHEAIVGLLVENGADVNVQGGKYGNALYAASYCGHEAIVGLLVEKGADVYAQGGRYGNALQVASSMGHEVVVCLLLEKGVDVNAKGGEHGNALQAASYMGHETIVGLLLENGADVNAQGVFYEKALQAASYRGHEAIVGLLLEM
jgi:ankyrin repeat protein